MHLFLFFSYLFLFLDKFLLNVGYCVEYVLEDLYDVIFLQKGFSLAFGRQLQ